MTIEPVKALEVFGATFEPGPTITRALLVKGFVGETFTKWVSSTWAFFCFYKISIQTSSLALGV
jgi:hypothetical protein